MSVALHAGLGLAATLPWQGVLQPSPRGAPQSLAVRPVLVALASHVPVPRHLDAPEHSETAASTAPATAAPPSLTSDASTSASAAVFDVLAGSAGPLALFPRSSDVDAPSRPADDWSLDAAALEGFQIQRLVFHAWVDASGHWAAVQITEIEPESQRHLISLLEARLLETRMTAAHRHGQPVPHQQRIELQLAPLQPLEPGAG